MNTILVKGHEIEIKITKSALTRKTVLFANNIIDDLKKLNISRDDIKIKTDTIGNRNMPAVIEFWTQGHYLRFSFSLTKRFIDNLYVIKELVRLEVVAVLNGSRDINDFYHIFSQDSGQKEIKKDLKNAKKILGLSEEEKDLEIINQNYKNLARKHHPDLGGNMEEFQKINRAHKLIKKEMGL